MLTSELVWTLELFLRTHSFYLHLSQFPSFIVYVIVRRIARLLASELTWGFELIVHCCGKSLRDLWQVHCCVVARPKSYLKSCRNLWQICCCVAGDLNQLFENPSGICGRFAVVWLVTLTNFLKIPWKIIVILLSVLVTSHKLSNPLFISMWSRLKLTLNTHCCCARRWDIYSIWKELVILPRQPSWQKNYISVFEVVFCVWCFVIGCKT